MKDIDGNFGGDISKIRGINFDGNAPISEKGELISSASHKEIDNLNNAQSALVGRSMVKKLQRTEPKFDGRLVDAVKGDLAALDENYAVNKKSVLLEDAAIKRGVPYEKALKMGEILRKG